jgi:hypothetical protein
VGTHASSARARAECGIEVAARAEVEVHTSCTQVGRVLTDKTADLYAKTPFRTF